jgi:hypothetical protein
MTGLGRLQLQTHVLDFKCKGLLFNILVSSLLNYVLVKRAQIRILSPLLLIYVKQFDGCSYMSYRQAD